MSTNPTEDLAKPETPNTRDRLAPLIQSITQREKFLLADRLSRPFHELMEDPDRVLVALAWVQLKRDNKGIGPNFDDLLDKTDAEILEVLGLDADADDAPGDDEAGKG